MCERNTYEVEEGSDPWGGDEEVSEIRREFRDDVG